MLDAETMQLGLVGLAGENAEVGQEQERELQQVVVEGAEKLDEEHRREAALGQ